MQPHPLPSAPCPLRWPQQSGLEDASGRQAAQEIPRQRWCQALFISPLPGRRMCQGFCPFPCGPLRMPDLPDLPGDLGHPKFSLVNYLLESANYQRELGVVRRQPLPPHDLYTCCALCLALAVPSLYLQISSSRSVICHLLQEAFLDLMHGS